MKMRTAMSCMAVLALAMSGANVAAESFGFEEPDLGDDGWNYHADLVGWSWTPVGGGAGLSGPDGPWECDSDSPDPLGDQFAFLQGICSISRTVTGLTVGALYEVTFYESGRTWGGGIEQGLAENDLTVIIDEGLGTEATIYENSIIDNPTWELRTASTFVPENTSVTLTFVTTNPLGGDRTTILDGVSIDEIPPPPITPSSAYAVAGLPFSLTAPAGGSGHQWSDTGGDLSDGGNISGVGTDVLTFSPLGELDGETYSVTYTFGSKASITTSYDLFVYPAGSVIPVTGLLGLGLLLGACAVGGASALRRKK